MSHITTAAGRRIYYDDLGAGAPLVVLPGMTAQRRGYVSWLTEALASRFRVISMDNRDTGESDPEAGYYSIRDVAGDIADLLDALDVDRTHVLGHSMGGAFAIRFAIDYPERVDRLVLAGTSGTWTPSHRAGEPLPPPDEYWSDDPVQRMRLVLPILVGSTYRERMTEEDVARISEIERPNRATWAGTMRQAASIDGHDAASHFASIHAPTLVLYGDEDGPEHKQALAEALPNGRAFVLPGVGHLPWVERPAETVGAIRDFLLEPNGSPG